MKKNYLSHNAQIKTYAPKDKLLIFKSFDDFSWEKLCGFIGVDVPKNVPFPFENKIVGDDKVAQVVDQLMKGTGNVDSGVSLFSIIDKEFKFRFGLFGVVVGLGLSWRFRDVVFKEELVEKIVSFVR